MVNAPGEISLPTITLASWREVCCTTEPDLYRYLVQAMLEQVILPPHLLHAVNGLGDSLLVDPSQAIHLLLIHPSAATHCARGALYERNLVLPYMPRFFVHSDIVQNKFVGSADDPSRLPCRIISKIVPATDIVQV